MRDSKYDKLLPHKGSQSLSASIQNELEWLPGCHESFPTGAFFYIPIISLRKTKDIRQETQILW
jgi:hypothetical protein